MDKTQQLKNALEFAKKNPNDPKSLQLRQRLESGMYDKELSSLKESGELNFKSFTERNTAQNVLGAFLDPIIRTGVRGGQAIANVGLEGINKLSGGALDKYTPEGNLSQALDRSLNTPMKVPILGTVIDPVKGITKKKIAGDALGTLALGIPSAPVAGGAIGASMALQEEGDTSDVAINTVVGALGGKILEFGFKAVAPYIEKAVTKYGTPMVEKLAQYVPEGSKKFMDDLASKIPTPSTSGKILPEGASKVIAKGEEIIAKADDLVNETGSKILAKGKEKLVDPFANKIKTKFKTRTPEEILATPEADVVKLGKEERKYYFDNIKESIAKKADETEKAIQAKLEAGLEKTTKQATDLQRELEVAGRDEVVALRPKIRKALGEQSKEYRRLVDEEISAVDDFTVSKDEMTQYVDKRFAENPEQAQNIKNILGMGESGTDTTIGKIYEKTQSLGKEIAGSAKKGARVYTPEEKATDDAISTLLDFMRDARGVDLKVARQFWAKYAPIRNQLVSEAKPFVQSPVQTKIFANTLKRVASGKDVNNENFIKEVEKLVGEKLGVKSKSLLKKISLNDKKMVANKLEAEMKRVEAELLKKQELGTLSEKEFLIERKASQREAIKNLFKTAIGITIVGSGANAIF